MELSTRTRYGVRLMVELAVHYGEGPVPLREIAQRQEISEKYLWNLMGPLKTIGLIRSTRGSYGGFVLSRPPSGINMKEVVSALEGSLCFAECVNAPSVCERVEICAARDIWGILSNKVMETLESMTLKDIIENHKNKDVPSSTL
jgi:Rrf2 family protein